MSYSRMVIFFLLLVLSAGHGVAPVHGADDGRGKKKELSRIKREIREKKKKIKGADRKARSILSDVDRLDKDIHSQAARVAAQKLQVQKSEEALRELRRDSSKIQRDLTGLKGLYRKRVRALYKMSRNGYPGMLLGTEGSSGSRKRIKYLATVAARDRDVISSYGQTLGNLSDKQSEIATRKKEVLQRKRALEKKKATLEKKKKEKTAILASVRKQKGLYERTLKELEHSSTKLWSMIKKTERKRKAARTAAVRARRTRVNAVPISTYKGRLSWPVSGQLVTRFGVQRHPKFGTRIYRRGIEIKARPGTNVRAIYDGEVAFAGWYKGYGKLVILKHGAKYYSLYGHLSELHVTKGSRVGKRNVLGLVGNTGSSRVPKLYFEVRSNGVAQNPLRWLAKR